MPAGAEGYASLTESNEKPANFNKNETVKDMNSNPILKDLYLKARESAEMRQREISQNLQGSQSNKSSQNISSPNQVSQNSQNSQTKEWEDTIIISLQACGKIFKAYITEQSDEENKKKQYLDCPFMKHSLHFAKRLISYANTPSIRLLVAMVSESIFVMSISTKFSHPIIY